MLGYRAAPDFVVDSSRAMTMEQLVEVVFDMSGSSTTFGLTVELLTPGRDMYEEDLAGRRLDYLHGVEFRNSVIRPIFRAEAVIIKEIVVWVFMGKAFELTGEVLLEFLGFLARTRGGVAVIETLGAELRAFLLSVQLRIGGDAVLLLTEIARVVTVMLLTVVQYVLLLVQVAQTSIEAIPALGGLVNAAFELFLSALEALIDLLEADAMLEEDGLVAYAGIPESDDPTMREFLAAWSEPLTE